MSSLFLKSDLKNPIYCLDYFARKIKFRVFGLSLTFVLLTYLSTGGNIENPDLSREFGEFLLLSLFSHAKMTESRGWNFHHSKIRGQKQTNSNLWIFLKIPIHNGSVGLGYNIRRIGQSTLGLFFPKNMADWRIEIAFLLLAPSIIEWSTLTPFAPILPYMCPFFLLKKWSHGNSINLNLNGQGGFSSKDYVLFAGNLKSSLALKQFHFFSNLKKTWNQTSFLHSI